MVVKLKYGNAAFSYFLLISQNYEGSLVKIYLMFVPWVQRFSEYKNLHLRKNEAGYKWN